MKNLAISGVLATAMSMLLCPFASASGWIVVDPILSPGAMPRVHVPPGTTTLPPRPGHTVLHGNVSFGLHMKSEEVRVDVADQIAKTYITQVFSNDTDSNLAGTYLFPLPDDTTFSSFSLQIDNKPVEGKILEAQEARQQYEAIVRSMIDPGLLEYADYKTVRARVFPIPAHGTKKVELEYTQVLKAENGMLKYRFPLKAEEDAEPADNIKIDVKLASKQGLRTIWSPTHTIASTRADNSHAKVNFEEKNTLPDKDFVLYYSVSDKDMAANLLTHKRVGEDGYYMLTLSPPVEAKTVDAKDIVLIADTSGSMQGEKMADTKKALKYLVNALGDNDRFGLVQFSTDVDAFKTELVPATAENKKKACDFVEDMEARGGTNISDAMHTGLKLLDVDSTRPAYVVMMTDGEPTVGETDPEKLIESMTSKRDVRVFDFGIGYDVNTRLLNKLASEHHGTAQYVEPNESMETVLSNFYGKIKSPVLSDVKIVYDGVSVKDVYPREVKDIFAGSQVLLLGRFKNDGKATVKLTGKLEGKEKEYTFPIDFSAEDTSHTYLPRLWAMRRIAHLTEVAQSNGQSREVIDEIVALSRKYGIITAYTSFLVTDPSVETHGSGMNRPMPTGPWAPVPVRGRMLDREVSQGFMKTAPAPMAAAADMAVGATSGTIGIGGRMFEARKEKAARSSAPAENIFGDEGFSGAAPVSGKLAVLQSKLNKDLSEQTTVVASDIRDASRVKTVGDKTFYLVDGFWTDSEYDSGKSKPEVVEFGSKKYFDLLKETPSLGKYFAVGRQVILSLDAHCYKIVQPAHEAG